MKKNPSIFQYPPIGIDRYTGALQRFSDHRISSRPPLPNFCFALLPMEKSSRSPGRLTVVPGRNCRSSKEYYNLWCEDSGRHYMNLFSLHEYLNAPARHAESVGGVLRRQKSVSPGSVAKPTGADPQRDGRSIQGAVRVEKKGKIPREGIGCPAAVKTDGNRGALTGRRDTWINPKYFSITFWQTLPRKRKKPKKPSARRRKFSSARCPRTWPPPLTMSLMKKPVS